MNIHKHIHYIISFSAGLLLMSCLNENEPESFFPTLATVNMEGNQVELESDSYGRLAVENPEVLKAGDADSTGQRVLVGVQFLKENQPSESQASEESPTPVKIIEFLSKVLTKRADDLRVGGTSDIYGDAPIQITAASISEHHLNIQYEIGNATPYGRHRISLVLTPDTQVDPEGLIQVEFRHNAEGDWGNERLWGIAAYTLESIPEYDMEGVKGFKILYNSGANRMAEWTVQKTEVTPYTYKRVHASTLDFQ